jgi:fatty acid synthase subunit alpha
MTSIFPITIDSSLLELVHLSNRSYMVNGAKSLGVGDMCYSEARIASVTNTDAGKVVEVKRHVYRWYTSRRSRHSLLKSIYRLLRHI